MNKLILTLLMVSSIAYADSWEIPNNGGEKIVLTDTPCSNKPNQYVAFTQTNEYSDFGCWFYSENYAMVTWRDGTVRIYPAKDFVKVQKQ